MGRERYAVSPEDAAAILRKALLSLGAEGDAGFEGLLAELLGAATGQTVRIAKRGNSRDRPRLGIDPAGFARKGSGTRPL